MTALPCLAATVGAASSESDAGRILYLSKGCYECHGLAAQGAMGVAPTLGPVRLPLQVFEAYLRKPGGQMPPYSAALLSKTELQAVYLYLNSLPKSPSAAQIGPLASYVE